MKINEDQVFIDIDIYIEILEKLQKSNFVCISKISNIVIESLERTGHTVEFFDSPGSNSYFKVTKK